MKKVKITAKNLRLVEHIKEHPSLSSEELFLSYGCSFYPGLDVFRAVLLVLTRKGFLFRIKRPVRATNRRFVYEYLASPVQPRFCLNNKKTPCVSGVADVRELAPKEARARKPRLARKAGFFRALFALISGEKLYIRESKNV